MRAKRRQLAAIACALLALAAAPPAEHRGGSPSAWSRIVQKAKTILHDPFGRGAREAEKSSNQVGVAPRRLPGSSDYTTAPAASPAARQVSAARPIGKPGAAETSAVKRASWWSRPKRPSRTVSEYMAQEKP